MPLLDVPPPPQPAIEYVIPATTTTPALSENWARDYGRTTAATTRLIKSNQAATMKNKKYTTLIFDLGEVLIKWQPEETAASLFPGTDASRIMHDLFRDPAWKAFDENKIDIDGLAKLAHEKYSHDRTFAKKVLHAVPHHLPHSEEIITAITQAKAQGYKVYILSNMPKPYLEVFAARLPVFKLFDGITASCHNGLMKPEPHIYNQLLIDFKINPHEALFVDDREVNILAGNALNIDGIVCVNQADVLNLFYDSGILVKPAAEKAHEK